MYILVSGRQNAGSFWLIHWVCENKTQIKGRAEVQDISILSYALLIYVLASGMENSVISYLAYALSAYALVITITGTAGIIGWIRRGIDFHPLIRKLHGIPVFERFLYEVEFRTETTLYQGLAVNLIYAGIKLFSGIYYHSIWFITLAAYYILLAVMRFSLLMFVRGKM